jgi:hypothetical protein
VIVIQLALLAAVQVHPAEVVTLTLPVVASAPTEMLRASIKYVHPAPACVTVMVCPAMVSVPVRALVLVLADIE